MITALMDITTAVALSTGSAITMLTITVIALCLPLLAPEAVQLVEVLRRPTHILKLDLETLLL